MTEGGGDAVVIERTFDVPVDQVWKMWTDPDRFRSWYGPGGASIPVAELDVRVGGSRRVCMEVQTPNGAMKMWFIGTHLEVIEHSRLVYTEAMADEAGNVLAPAAIGMPDGHPMTTEVRVELAGKGDRTTMVMTHTGVPSESPGAAGWAMAFDKLTALLGTSTAP